MSSRISEKSRAAQLAPLAPRGRGVGGEGEHYRSVQDFGSPAASHALTLGPSPTPGRGEKEASLSRSALGALVRNRSLMLLTLSYAAVGYFEYLFYFWMHYYFEDVLHLGKEESRVFATVLNLSLAGGMLLGGWVAGRLRMGYGHRKSRALQALGLGAAIFETWEGLRIEGRSDAHLAPLKHGASGWITRAGGALSGPVPAILRAADWVIVDEIKKHGLYRQVWQSFAVLTPLQTVGVMGDFRTYANVVAVRPRCAVWAGFGG